MTKVVEIRGDISPRDVYWSLRYYVLLSRLQIAQLEPE